MSRAPSAHGPAIRSNIVREVFLKEVRETLRDRRSMAMMFGIPILLYPLLTMGMAGLAQSTVRKMQEQPARLAIIGAESAPGLTRLARGRPEKLSLRPPAGASEAIAAGALDAVIEVPDGAERKALAGEDVKLRIRVDQSRQSSGIQRGKVEDLIDAYERRIIEARLKSRGVSADVLKPLTRETIDTAGKERRFGAQLGTLLPMMLLITGMLGAFFPAVNTTTAERELMTLESLLVTPARKLELLLGKGLLVLICALLTSALNMASMALVMWRITSQAAGADVGFAVQPGPMILAYLAAVPTLVFFAGAVMVVGLMARNYREANSYATPVMLVSMVPMAVSISDPKTTLALLVTPCVNATIVIRDVLRGHVDPGAFAISFLSSAVYAVLMLAIAARLFTSESLVSPAASSFSFRGLMRGGKRLPRPPALDEALGLFAVSMVLLFYVAPSLAGQSIWVMLPAVQGLLVAGPALVGCWLFRYPWRETLSWRRSTAAQNLGGALLGIGCIPAANFVASGIERLWPHDPAAGQAAQRFLTEALSGSTLQAAAAILAIGLSAGITEELLYRGPILDAFRRKMPAWAAVLVSALLFASAHLDPQGIPARAALGCVLGWVVMRSGSLLPAVLMHAAYDCFALGLHRWAPKGSILDLSLAGTISPGSVFPVALQLGFGLAITIIGYRLLASSRPLVEAPSKTDAAFDA